MFRMIVQWISAHPLKAIIAVALLSSIVSKSIPKSDEQIAKEEQKKIEKQQKEELREKQRQERKEELQRKDDKETQDFINSKERIKIYSSTANADTMQWATIKAKSGIKGIANDPDSITDVTPTTELIRMRIKDIPDARFAMSVSYRGKNKLSAVVSEEATVVFNKNYDVIKILPNISF